MAESWVLLVLAAPSSCNQCILGTFAEPGNCQTGEGLMERWHIQIEPRRLLRLSGGEQDKSGRRGGSGGPSLSDDYLVAGKYRVQDLGR